MTLVQDSLTYYESHIKKLYNWNYDKENLVLESTNGNKPNIVLDMQRINRIKTFPLPKDLEADKEDSKDNKKPNRKEKFVDKRVVNDNRNNRQRQQKGVKDGKQN